MSHVVFAFGDRPGIDGVDALEIANLLEMRRNLATRGAANKIRAEALKLPDRAPASVDIDLELSELVELLALLDEPTAIPDSEAVKHLHEQLKIALREV